MRLTLLVLAVASFAAACGGDSALGPGAKVGSMSLANDGLSAGDSHFFDFCDPFLRGPGVYERSCDVPAGAGPRIWVGYGVFAETQDQLESEWSAVKWSLWIDDHRVDLPSFGTSDRVLYGLPQAGGKNVILREWKVTIVEPTAGEHKVRYRSEPANGTDPGVTDATWTFTMQPG